MKKGEDRVQAREATAPIVWPGCLIETQEEGPSEKHWGGVCRDKNVPRGERADCPFLAHMRIMTAASFKGLGKNLCRS